MYFIGNVEVIVKPRLDAYVNKAVELFIIKALKLFARYKLMYFDS